MPTRDEVHYVEDIADGTVLGPDALSVAVPTPTVGTAADYIPGALLSSEEYFYSKCSASDLVGNAVYANTTTAFVSTADCSQPYPVLGFIVAKSSPTDCTVQRYGESDLVFQGLTAGKRYFLAEMGGITSPPFPNNSVEFVQQVGSAISDTRLFIQPTGTVIRRDVTGGGDEMVCCSSLLHGQGNPTASVGKDDDFYIDVIANVLFGPKAQGAWPDGVSLVGPPGRPGPAGPQGDVGPAGADSTVAGPAGKDSTVPGPQGPAGADSTVPGPQGPAGKDGRDGKDSTVPGPAGAPGADSTVPGPAGKDGADSTVPGPQGPQGDQGERGNTILHGQGVPQNSDGEDGDYFYSTNTTTFYGPKQSGNWPSVGVQMMGQDGKDGVDGTEWFAGDGPPAAQNDYPAGSYYYDRVNKQIYPPAG